MTSMLGVEKEDQLNLHQFVNRFGLRILWHPWGCTTYNFSHDVQKMGFFRVV